MKLAGALVSIGVHTAAFALVGYGVDRAPPAVRTTVTVRRLEPATPEVPPPPAKLTPQPTSPPREKRDPAPMPEPKQARPNPKPNESPKTPVKPELAGPPAPVALDAVLSNEGLAGGHVGSPRAGAGEGTGSAPPVPQVVAPLSPPTVKSCDEQPSKPEVVNKTQIAYPAAARTKGIEGRIVLRAHIDASGNVSKVDVLRSAGPEIDGPAVAALRSWRFRPAVACGKPTHGTYTVARRFELGT